MAKITESSIIYNLHTLGLNLKRTYATSSIKFNNALFQELWSTVATCCTTSAKQKM